MKKGVFTIFIALLGFTSMNAQQFNLGASLGIPTGDIEDFTTLNLNIDAAYLWDVADKFELGVATGYSHFLGDEIAGFEIDDISYMPVAVAARYEMASQFSLGLDLGYGIGISDGFDGGFYISPKVQYAVKDNLSIVLAYKNVSAESSTSVGSVNLGVEFKL